MGSNTYISRPSQMGNVMMRRLPHPCAQCMRSLVLSEQEMRLLTSINSFFDALNVDKERCMCFTPAACPCLWSERLSASEFKCLKAVVYKTWWQMDDYKSMLSAAIGGQPSHVELLKVVV